VGAVDSNKVRMSAAGFANGSGSQAKFSGPAGVAVGSNGVIYVADAGNNLIRQIQNESGTWTVSTFGRRRSRGGVRLGAAGQGRISSVGGKPTSEGLASHRVARPWELGQ
jgi:NHL repeat